MRSKGIIRVFGFSTVGNRSENQDDYYVNHCYREKDIEIINYNMYGDVAIGVFDGIGGGVNGKYASRLAVQLLDTIVIELLSNNRDMRSILAEYNITYSKCIYEDIGSLDSAGTTVVLALIIDKRLYVCWIGDSRAYLYSKGKLTLLTRDDSVGQEYVEAGLMTEIEARKTKYWHQLTSYLGDLDSSFKIEGPLSIKNGDKVLLCTDGVTDSVMIEKIEEAMQSENEIFVLKEMVECNMEDNATAIVIK